MRLLDAIVVGRGNQELVVMKRAFLWLVKALFLALAGILAVIASFAWLVILLPFLPLAIAAHGTQTLYNRYIND